MISPKRIVQTLLDHWPTIQTLIVRNDSGSFSFQNLQSLILHHNPAYSSEQSFKEAQRLLANELIIPLAKSSELELNLPVLEFGQFLLDEHSLGLAEEVSVLLDDMDRLTTRVRLASEDKDAYEVKRNLYRLDDRIRKVIKHFQHNEIAIANLVEEAKSQKSSIPLEKRYASVLDAFDQYIEPMLDMLDIFGKFRLTCDKIEDLLSGLIETADTLGQMKREQQSFINLRSRVLEVFQLGQQSLRRSTDLLMPLRDELRKNTEVTRAVSKVLASIRKQGLNHHIHNAMPVIATETARHNLGLHRHIVSYLADVIETKEDDIFLPDDDQLEPYEPIDVPDFREVLAETPSKQTDDFLGWLKDKYQDIPSDELLYLYLQLTDSDQINLSDHRERREYRLNKTRLIAYSLGGHKAGNGASNNESTTDSAQPDMAKN
ncbi:hypothetical protein ACFOEK_04745 [Litoribrevibacter euphylliae]|uniref:DUF3375 domain-containing protein n=1 Tax=Litoribrevibacter euphylliae TaxID=1834034 RepID=A0ABV7HCC0_9GAMM